MLYECTGKQSLSVCQRYVYTCVIWNAFFVSKVVCYPICNYMRGHWELLGCVGVKRAILGVSGGIRGVGGGKGVLGADRYSRNSGARSSMGASGGIGGS